MPVPVVGAIDEALLICAQRDCDEPTAFLYTWPGRDQAGVCVGHSGYLQRVAEAMDLHLQLLPFAAPREAIPCSDQSDQPK